MSIRVMSWVWENSAAKGTERLVLLAIADNADDDGGNAWPSVLTLARKCQVDERTVQRSIRKLTMAGHLAVLENAGPGGSNRYRVAMRHPRQVATPGEVPPPKDAAPSGLRDGTLPPRQIDTPAERHQGGGTLPPEPSLNHPVELPNGSSLTLAKQRDDVERICKHLADRVEANGSKRPRITAKWRIAARLLLDADGKTEEQIHTAIDWCQSNDFWRANILSLPKLREKYDQMRLMASRGTASTTNRRVTAAVELAAKYQAEEAAHAQI